jgi:hypothetical protein
VTPCRDVAPARAPGAPARAAPPYHGTPLYSRTEAGLRPPVQASQPSGRASPPRGVPTFAAQPHPLLPAGPSVPFPLCTHACRGRHRTCGIMAWGSSRRRLGATPHLPAAYLRGLRPLLAGSAPPLRHHGRRRRAPSLSLSLSSRVV